MGQFHRHRVSQAGRRQAGQAAGHDRERARSGQDRRRRHLGDQQSAAQSARHGSRAAARALPAQNRFHAEQQTKYHGRSTAWPRPCPMAATSSCASSSARSSRTGSRAPGSLSSLQGSYPDDDEALPFFQLAQRARRAGRDPSAVGRLRRGAHARLSAGLERRPPDGWRARGGAADRARRVREAAEAQGRRHPSRRRHLRDDRPHGLCLPAAGRGLLPRLLRADADQAPAAATISR